MNPQILDGAGHVEDRNSLGNCHDQGNPSVGGLKDRIGRAGRRYEDHGGVRARLLDRLIASVEDRHAKSRLTPATRSDATDEDGAVVAALFRVKRARLASDTLTNQPRVLIDQNAHGWTPGVGA